jgi:cellobiose dehydrogenase (acceptor)
MDQLNIVKNSTVDGPTMIVSDQWINLPVGHNLNDHVGVCAPMPILWHKKGS